MSAEGSSSQVRRIAILVTSLDASAGRQLLMAMPTDLARQVRRAMTQLGHVDPEEQRQILAEFRMQAMTASDSPSAALDAKPGAQAMSRPADDEREVAETGQYVSEFKAIGAATSHGAMPAPASSLPNRHTTIQTGHNAAHSMPLSTLSELLRGERATVVAVVLSQLEPQAAAELLGRLPKPLQREAIVSLSRIGQIDPDAMQAIDEHLSSRIADYHHRQAGESESTGRMQELLAAAAPDLRSEWQHTLVQAEPQLAARLGIAPPAPLKSTPSQPARLAPTHPATTQSASIQATPMAGSAAGVTAGPTAGPVAGGVARPARTRTDSPTADTATNGGESAARMLELLANNVVTTADLPMAKKSSSFSAASASEIEDDGAHILPFPTKGTQGASIRFEQILDLPAEEIGQILAAADTEVILYALAGASPAFMKRFMAMLDRADGRALQARLKQLRAINLKDVDAAQRRLCELAGGRAVAKAA